MAISNSCLRQKRSHLILGSGLSGSTRSRGLLATVVFPDQHFRTHYQTALGHELYSVLWNWTELCYLFQLTLSGILGNWIMDALQNNHLVLFCPLLIISSCFVLSWSSRPVLSSPDRLVLFCPLLIISSCFVLSWSSRPVLSSPDIFLISSRLVNNVAHIITLEC